MLPAWATVAIALGGSALTALASIGVAYLTKKQESVAEWRKLLVEAAHGFSTSLSRAIRAVREAIEASQAATVEGLGTNEAVNAAVLLIDEASDRLDHVLLLYGQDSKTGRPAKHAVDLLRKATAELRRFEETAGGNLPPDDDLAKPLHSASGACTTAENEHQQFNRMAWNALPGRPYRFLGALRD
jgi:hypothetical protein